MYRYEIQLLGRSKSDHHRYFEAVGNAGIQGALGFKSYDFGGIEGLIVFVEGSRDRDAVIAAVPGHAVVGAWPLCDQAEAA